MLYLSTSASHSHGNGNSPIPLHNHHTPVSVQAHIITKCCFRAIIIIIIMFYYAIMTARHTVQYTHTHIQSYTQMHPLKRHKMIKTVKRYKGTELVKHVRHRPTLLCWSGSVYSRVVSVLDSGARAWVQISVAMLSG